MARHAAQIVSRVYERGDQGSRNVHLHPFVHESRDLAEMVATLHIAESKQSHVLAAALFELVAEVVPPPPLPPGSHQKSDLGSRKSETFQEHVLAITGSTKSTVAATKKIMRAQLLEFARTLPFGPQIHKHNLISFLPAMKELSRTLALIKGNERNDITEGGSKRAGRDGEEGEEEDARVILGLMTNEEIQAERSRERLTQLAAPGGRRSTWDKLRGAYI